MGAKKKDDSKSLLERSKDKNESVVDMNDRRASFIAAFNKDRKGHGQIKLASDYRMPYLTKRLPTGLLSLDVELRGGFPAGGLSQIAGPKNSGKSYLYWQVIRQLQHILGNRMNVMLAMTEMRADRQQGRLAGVKVALNSDDIHSLNSARVNSGWPPFTDVEIAEMQGQVGNIDEMHGESAEVLFDGILDAVACNAYHLIVIDSFGSIMTSAEAEAESLGEKFYGGSAKVTTEFLRKLTAFLTIDDENGQARDVCILGINQVRDAIGDPHKDFRSPGGRALEHAKFVDLFVSSGASIGFEEPIYTSMGTKKRYIQTGKEINWKIEKGKAGIHEGGKGSYVYDFRINQADFYLDSLVSGVRCGVIQTAGAWINLTDPTSGEVILKANGKDAFVAAMVEDSAKKAAEGSVDTVLNRLRDLCFKSQGININYQWE